MDIAQLTPWHLAWTCSVPLIVLNVIIHIFGLTVIQLRLAPALSRESGRSGHVTRLAAVMVVTVTAITGLHAFEGVVWAVAYRVVGAISDNGGAMLYSIDAMTTYGHTPVTLAPHWQMMGALEALNGMILFGLSAAFLFAMVQSSAMVRRR